MGRCGFLRALFDTLLLLLVAIFCFHGFSYSQQGSGYTFVHQATTAPAVSYYDYIIIGGGTAGCPLAATLSSTYKVLLIERGGSPYGNPNITNLSSVGVSVQNTRARVLGGGSCLNAGFYTRAEQTYVKDAGWDRKLVNESYEWVEKKVVFEPRMLSWQTAVRDGLLEAGVLPNNGFTFDHLNGTKVGGTIFDRNGHRHTSADLLQYGNSKRLTVLLHATAHRILFKTRGRARPVAHGVIFSDASGVKHRAYLNKIELSKNEIIISAGALGSPQLLMLSGVGPSEHLRSHNIKVVSDHPFVGQGMSDNPMNLIFIPSPIDVEISAVQLVGITEFGSYIEAVSGLNFSNLLTSHGVEQNFKEYLPHQTSQLFDVPPKPRSAEATVEVRNGLDFSAFKGGFIAEKVSGPLSTGHLELKNKNPNDNPVITFNYFKEPEELRRCINGVKTIQKVIESSAFSKFRYPYLSFQDLVDIVTKVPLNFRPKHNNTATSLEQFCKDTVMTIWHYHGGCQVGRVVDPHDYKVLGIDALRVIDGSTFKYSPGTNPQATLMMLGRYMGIKILNGRITS